MKIMTGNNLLQRTLQASKKYFERFREKKYPGITGSAIKELMDFLEGSIISRKKASYALEALSRFRRLDEQEQEKYLPAIYLTLEEFITELDKENNLTRPELRKAVNFKYSVLMEL